MFLYSSHTTGAAISRTETTVCCWKLKSVLCSRRIFYLMLVIFTLLYFFVFRSHERTQIMPCYLHRYTKPTTAMLESWIENLHIFPASRCSPFAFGGCHGNANNFPSEAECARECAAPAPPEPPTPDVGGDTGIVSIMFGFIDILARMRS
jgi:hypothetical protein